LTPSAIVSCEEWALREGSPSSSYTQALENDR
jgi:hypothetical protein